MTIPSKIDSRIFKINGANGEVWAVGGFASILRCSGSNCIELLGGGSSTYIDIFVTPLGDAYAVGSNFAFCNNTNCIAATVNGKSQALSVVGNSNEIWFGEALGALDKINVKTSQLVSVATGTTDHLQSMWMSSSGEVWAVGSRSMIRCSASSCSSLPWVATDDLISVWGSSSGEVWAVGKAGNVVKCSGAACSLLPKVSDDNLHKVAGDERGVVWALGGGSSVVRCSGSACEKIALQGVAALADLWVSGAGEVWVAGGFGAILSFAP